MIVAFLGDNVYPKGLHEPSHPEYESDVESLETQLDVIRGTSARAIFLLGNHDWGYSDERGLKQAIRQELYLRAAATAGVNATLAPQATCPGPKLIPAGALTLLVALDTDLWLRDDAPGSHCPNRSTEQALNSLRQALRENAKQDRRHVVVLAHHPIETEGPHGGHFTFKDHIFPATHLWEPLYIPVPFLYPLARRAGISREDISNPRNAQMREELAEVFREFPSQPLVYAAGHDHNLQVFVGDEHGIGFILVSGAGSKLTPVGDDDVLFAAGKQHEELGYMRLDFLSDGRVLLSVITDGTNACDHQPGCKAKPTLRYWRWLAG